jgi:hypothetical protein
MSLKLWLPVLALIGLTGATGANADPQFRPIYSAAIAQAPSEPAPPRPVVAAAVDAGQYTLDVDVEGPAGKTIQAGRPVKLRAVVKVTRTGAGAVTATSPFDDAPIAFRWRLANPPHGFDLAEWTDSDGRSVVFAAPETGEYHFTLSASMWTGGPIPLLDDEGYTLINAGGQTPTDPPKPPVDPPAPPVPPTPPAPVPPVDPPVTPPAPQPAEFAMAVRDAVIRLVPASCRDKGLLLGKSYASAATDAEKLAAVDMLTELRARKAENDTMLGTDRAMWDGFFVWLAPELKRRIAIDGTSAKGLDVATAWSQVSLGLLLATGGAE